MNVREALAGSLDLWGCMWEPDERGCFETAVVRALTDEQPRAIRLQALALCQVIATPRLLAAAARLSRADVFAAHLIRRVEWQSAPLYRALQAAVRLRGNLLGLERLLARALRGEDAEAERLLDLVDLRDLVAVARTTVDARVFAEVQRRVARRGRYQRGRAANVLGFRCSHRETRSERRPPQLPGSL